MDIFQDGKESRKIVKEDKDKKTQEISKFKANSKNIKNFSLNSEKCNFFELVEQDNLLRLKAFLKRLKYLYKKIDDGSHLLWSHDNSTGVKKLRSEMNNDDIEQKWRNKDTTQTGYGEITAGSMLNLFNLFQNMSALLQQNGFGFSYEKCQSYNMDSNSFFLDIGSGFGKPNFHAAFQVGCTSKGIEVVPARAEFCLDFYYEYFSNTNKGEFFETCDEIFFNQILCSHHKDKQYIQNLLNEEIKFEVSQNTSTLTGEIFNSSVNVTKEKGEIQAFSNSVNVTESSIDCNNLEDLENYFKLLDKNCSKLFFNKEKFMQIINKSCRFKEIFKNDVEQRFKEKKYFDHFHCKEITKYYECFNLPNLNQIISILGKNSLQNVNDIIKNYMNRLFYFNLKIQTSDIVKGEELCEVKRKRNQVSNLLNQLGKQRGSIEKIINSYKSNVEEINFTKEKKEIAEKKNSDITNVKNSYEFLILQNLYMQNYILNMNISEKEFKFCSKMIFKLHYDINSFHDAFFNFSLNKFSKKKKTKKRIYGYFFFNYEQKKLIDKKVGILHDFEYFRESDIINDQIDDTLKWNQAFKIKKLSVEINEITHFVNGSLLKIINSNLFPSNIEQLLLYNIEGYNRETLRNKTFIEVIPYLINPKLLDLVEFCSSIPLMCITSNSYIDFKNLKSIFPQTKTKTKINSNNNKTLLNELCGKEKIIEEEMYQKVLKNCLHTVIANQKKDWYKNISFDSEDATKCSAYFYEEKDHTNGEVLFRHHYTHIYSYNKLMSKECRKKISKILNKTDFKILAWYNNPVQTKNSGLKYCHFVAKFPMQSTSTEKFSVYVYIKDKDLVAQEDK